MYILFTKENCKWCNLAKSLLDEMGNEIEEKKYLKDFYREELEEELAKFNITTDKITLPQIFGTTYNGLTYIHTITEYIGTYEDLLEYLKEERTI